MTCLTERDEKRLEGVHPDLVRVIRLAAAESDIPFMVIEGVRDEKRQAKLVKAGASQTMNSKHLLGRAVDIAPLDSGRVSWHWPHYYPLARAVKKAAAALGVPVQWGGDWPRFKDGPHWELKDEHPRA